MLPWHAVNAPAAIKTPATRLRIKERELRRWGSVHLLSISSSTAAVVQVGKSFVYRENGLLLTIQFGPPTPSLDVSAHRARSIALMIDFVRRISD